MTCIVAVKDSKGKTYLGGDRIASDGFTKVDLAVSKIFSKKTVNGNEMLIGYTTSFRFGQLIQYGPDLPEDTTIDAMEYMISGFVPYISTLLEDGLHLTKKDGVANSGALIACYRDRIFKVQEDFAVVENAESFASVGSGAYWASGAFHALSQYGEVRDGRYMIEACISVAAKNCVTVSSAYDIITYGKV